MARIRRPDRCFTLAPLPRSRCIQSCHTPNGRRPGGWYLDEIRRSRMNLIPSAISQADSAVQVAFNHKLSLALALLLIVTYGLSMLFSLKTHRQLFASAAHKEAAEKPWPMSLALATLADATALVAVVSDIFVESVQ